MQPDPHSENVAVTKFLQGIVNTQERLQELARLLRLHPEISGVKVYPFVPSGMTLHHWDEEQVKKAFGADFGVSSELRDGAVIDWWLQVRCEEGCWHTTSYISRSDVGEDGSYNVIEFGEQQSVTLEAFLGLLSERVAEYIVIAGAPEMPSAHPAGLSAA